MVESVTTSVVEHVPGGNYAREKLTVGLDRVEDATVGVLDAVPGVLGLTCATLACHFDTTLRTQARIWDGKFCPKQ